MPIPNFDEDGLLPTGIFDCTLAEIRHRFGSFQSSDRRPELFSRLNDLVLAFRQTGLFKAVLIDGSFVTAKARPNDIDLIAVLTADHDFERELPMQEYALVSRPLLRRRFGLDVALAREDSELYSTYVEFFSRVRGTPHLRKGLLRLTL